ncbi:hypothetical protein MRX96_019062 [Rhipicephalus microplus]
MMFYKSASGRSGVYINSGLGRRYRRPPASPAFGWSRFVFPGIRYAAPGVSRPSTDIRGARERATRDDQKGERIKLIARFYLFCHSSLPVDDLRAAPEQAWRPTREERKGRPPRKTVKHIVVGTYPPPTTRGVDTRMKYTELATERERRCPREEFITLPKMVPVFSWSFWCSRTLPRATFAEAALFLLVLEPPVSCSGHDFRAHGRASLSPCAV